MAVLYATRADLIASPFRPAAVAAPEDPEAIRLLESASRRIDTLLIASVYRTDLNGAPTDPRVAAALRDAVCAQVVWWLQTGDESGTAGLYQRVAIGSVQLDRTTTAGRLAPDVAPRALDVLRLAGLLGQGPWVS